MREPVRSAARQPRHDLNDCRCQLRFAGTRTQDGIHSYTYLHSPTQFMSGLSVISRQIADAAASPACADADEPRRRDDEISRVSCAPYQDNTCS